MNPYYKSRLDVSRHGYKSAAERFDRGKACWSLLQMLEKFGIYKPPAGDDHYFHARNLVDAWHQIHEEIHARSK